MRVRTFAPEVIKRGHKTYYRFNTVAGFAACGHSRILNTLREHKKVLEIPVLSSHLRARFDFHNQPYKPQIWVYTSIKPEYVDEFCNNH